MLKSLFFSVLFFALTSSAWSASFYSERPDDPKAVYLTAAEFDVHANGIDDDSEAIQQAINQVQESTNQGILFVPEGRYRISKTINVWPGIRIIGYGEQRPVFLLADNTTGYGDENAEKQMIFFAGRRPGANPFGRGPVPEQFRRFAESDPNAPPPDAGAGTFYSAMSNIDIEIGAGNHGAVGVRGTYAQHSFLAHMDFRLASGIAGVHDTGNVMEDIKFYGGRYGIWTRTPSPSWQFMAVDAVFEGQSESAIRETMAGLTLVRPTFRNVPTAISVDEGITDNMWVKNARLENISGPALVISAEKSPRTQINWENAICSNVATFALLRDSGKEFKGPADTYEVEVFSHGLHYEDINAIGEVKNIFETENLSSLPAPYESDLWPLPAMDSWVNIKDLGARGDGKTDDTAILKQAIAEHKTIYFPMGYYVVSNTIKLKEDTVLVGLHPSLTQIALLDNTPAYKGVGAPVPLVEAPSGGSNIISGIGLNTNGINPRATALLWKAGIRSMVNDVKFHGGHGTGSWDGGFAWHYNNNRTGDADPQKRWDAQYPSLWITDGGGGTFFDIWTASSYAQSGMLVSNTSTEGRVYMMSIEHHVRYEVQVKNVENWEFYALQTEAERGESGFMLPLEITDSNNLTIANTHMYRVISSNQPYPYGIKVSNSGDIRIRNLHSYTNSKVAYDALLYDQSHDARLWQHEFAWLTLSGKAPRPRPVPVKSVIANKAGVQKLAGNFYNIAGGAVDGRGNYYFVDDKWNRIYRWSADSGQLDTIMDAPIQPRNLAIDRSGNVMVTCYEGDGTVFAFKPGDGPEHLQRIEAVPSQPRPNMMAVIPAGNWGFWPDFARRDYHYVSPDGTMFIAAGEAFTTGATSWGVKSTDLLRGFGLAPVIKGRPFYYTYEGLVVTYITNVLPDGNMSKPEPFVYQGGESVAVDKDGNVYIAAGLIYIYNSKGELLDTIEVPERPTHIAFGGEDGSTLYIAARSSLYSVRTRN